MAKKTHARPTAEKPAEAPASVAVTVAWLLSNVTTLVCAGVAGLAWLAARGREGNESVLLFAQFLHFSAIVAGCLSLMLLAAVLKIREDPPPLPLVVVSVIVAALPIVALFW